jgi:hypothetical protein
MSKSCVAFSIVLQDTTGVVPLNCFQNVEKNWIATKNLLTKR